MNSEMCGSCQYFYQHYGINKRKIFRVYCGHCTFSGAKRKRPDSKACENFAPGEQDAEAFASKEYLSKELLQYVLHLPLLPEIEETPAEENKKQRNG